MICECCPTSEMEIGELPEASSFKVASLTGRNLGQKSGLGWKDAFMVAFIRKVLDKQSLWC